MLRVADDDLPVQRSSELAEVVSDYVDQLEKLEDDERDQAETQAGLLHDRVFQLAADPTKSNGLPTPLDRVPHIEFAALENSVDRLQRSAKAYDEAVAKNGADLPRARLEHLQLLMLTIDQTLAPEIGLPGRSWYKNLIYAPGRLTGYEAKTLPGVREAIEDRRWADANHYAAITAQALNKYSDRLDEATTVLNGE